MEADRSRNKDQIFAEMHRELRRWNPEIPESVDRLDPVLKILLELYAYQLERIDQRIDRTWKVAVNSLIKALAPESKKWPVPAFTVLKCGTDDDVVEIDPHTTFFYKEEREAGQTFFFSSQKDEKLVAAEVKHLYVCFDDQCLNLSPNQETDDDSSYGGQERSTPNGRGTVYIAIEYTGMPSNLREVTLFLDGSETVLKQMRWGHWYPGSNFGQFFEDSGFCPGLTTQVGDLFAEAGEEIAWGGLRSSEDMFKSLENNFVRLSTAFSSTWELGPADSALLERMEKHGIDTDPLDERFYWIKAVLPQGGDKGQFLRGLNMHFNCFVATNKSELSTYKYTGGNRIFEIELPEPCHTILDITTVVDSDRNEYQPLHKVVDRPGPHIYTLEETDNKLRLWFDFSGQIDRPPDNITVHYTITAGTAANGIAVGKIKDLYEKHPGVTGCHNVIPVRGAIPAKTEEQIVKEISLRLRNRDRVVNFTEVAAWAETFDPRIQRASCRNGVQLAERGVRRCIVVDIVVGEEEFYSEDESSLLKSRLAQFLKSRSPVNTHYQVEISRK